MARPLDPNSRRAKLERLKAEFPKEKLGSKSIRVMESMGVDIADFEAVAKYRRNSQRADSGKEEIFAALGESRPC